MVTGRNIEIENELDRLVTIIREWKLSAGVSIERAITFTRTDGRTMLYIKMAVGEYYLHVEGMLRNDQLGFYAKWTKSSRNKHGHREEIIGWDNLYHDVPHIHCEEGTIREDRTTITCDEIEEYLTAFLQEEAK